MCTCSMRVQASFRVSAIFKRTMTTDSRRRQKADVDSFSSCTRLFFVVMMPMAYSLRSTLFIAARVMAVAGSFPKS